MNFQAFSAVTREHPTRLSRFCEGVIEAGWLTALIVTPLFFNPYSYRIFEPDKTATLRSIGLIMGLAWIIKGLEHWAGNKFLLRPIHSLRSVWQAVRGRALTMPVVAATVLMLIDHIAATAFSVNPRVSLWGSYPRLQGLYTTAVYAGIFLSVLVLLRRRDQLDRLITTTLFISVPVALYGIIQYWGTDPMAWGSDVTHRVTSTMGNPLFVAAFLILTVPPALYRLLASGRAAAETEGIVTKRLLVTGGLLSLIFQMAAWQASPIAGTASAAITVGTWIAVAHLLGKPRIPFLRIGSYTVVLSAQLMCLVFSQSRGPWLGLGAGLFLFALLWTLVQRRRRHARVVIGTGLAVVLLLIAMNVPSSPFSFMRDIPYAGRLGQLADIGVGSGRVRVLIWEGVDEMIADNPVRSAVGYGPETLLLVYPPYYSSELARIQKQPAVPDRAHNETLDALVTTGVIGVLIYLLLFTALFHGGLKWLGILGNSVRNWIFLGLWFGGGAAGLLLPRLIDGSWRFTGIGVPAGMIAGLFIYLCGHGLSMKREPFPDRADRRPRLVVVAILAILVAHFLEIQLGLAIVATRTYFWIYAGLLAALGFAQLRRSDPSEDASTEGQNEPVVDKGSQAQPSMHPFLRSAKRPLLALSLVAGFALATLAYDFLVPATDLRQVLSIVWLAAFTWAFGGFIIITETLQVATASRGVRLWVGASLIYAGVSLGVAVLYAAVHWSLARLGAAPESVLPAYLVGLLLVIAALGWVLTFGRRQTDRTWARRLVLPYLFLTAGILYVAVTTNVNPVLADVYFKQGLYLTRFGQYDRAVAQYQRAIALQPDEDGYHLFLGKAWVEMAGVSENLETELQNAERALSRAHELAPRNPDHVANLARLYLAWARGSEDPAMHEDRLERAADFFEQATDLSPNTPRLWNEQAVAYLLMEDTTAAVGAYRRSLEVDSVFFQTHLLLGNLYLAQERWGDAVSAYERAIELNGDSPQTRIALGYAKARTNDEQ